MSRVIFAFVFAPPLVAAIGSVMSPLGWVAALALRGAGLVDGVASGVLLGWVAVTTAVYAATVLLGVPAYLLMAWRGWNRPWHFAVAGGVVAIPLCLALVVGLARATGTEVTLTEALPGVMQFSAFFAMHGAIGGLIFYWLLFKNPLLLRSVRRPN